MSGRLNRDCNVFNPNATVVDWTFAGDAIVGRLAIGHSVGFGLKANQIPMVPDASTTPRDSALQKLRPTVQRTPTEGIQESREVTKPVFHEPAARRLSHLIPSATPK